jgi:RNA polymerase sigma-70 factor (ECF subfamily)
MRERDETLIDRTRAGEKGAYFELVKRHHGPVLMLSYALTGDADEARDLCQEAFLRAYRSLRHLASGTFGDWMVAQVRRLHEEWRKRKQMTFERLEGDQKRAGTVDARTARAYRLLATHFCGLDEEGRQVTFAWHRAKGDLEAVAREIGETPGAVQAQVARAHKLMRERLEKELDLSEFDR